MVGSLRSDIYFRVKSIRDLLCRLDSIAWSWVSIGIVGLLILYYRY